MAHTQILPASPWYKMIHAAITHLLCLEFGAAAVLAVNSLAVNSCEHALELHLHLS
jgi:hypothetical protein